MTENNQRKTLLTRRHVIKGASVAAGATAVGGAAIWYGSQPAVAAHLDDWSADDVTDDDRVESDDGSVIAVYTQPSIDIEWSNFANGADSADVTLTAHLRSTDNDHIDEDVSDVVFDATGIDSTTSSDGVSSVDDEDGPLDGSSVNGGVTINLAEIDITDTHDEDGSGETEDITESEFEDETSAEGNQITTVELELDTVVTGAQSANPVANVTTSFDVEVENLQETQSTGGNVTTRAE